MNQTPESIIDVNPSAALAEGSVGDFMGPVAPKKRKIVPRDRTGVAVRTLHMRIKDKHAPLMREMSRAVNMVWNYCNDLGMKVLDREHRFINGKEIQGYLNGASKEGLCIGSTIFQQVAEEFGVRRKQFAKRRLSWRKSGGARRSLGWIPFKDRSVSYKGGQVLFQGKLISLWDSFNFASLAPGALTLRSGCFCEDSRGRWYLNVTIEIANSESFVGPQRERAADVGIDLGLKEFAALSDGRVIEANRFYRDLEPKLATAQRANKKDRAKAIHTKASNRRKDALHKLSTSLVRSSRLISVGNVNASALAKTSMAKSVLDAGWSTFRDMLLYKGDSAGVHVKVVNESFSTQDCSACGARAGPKGLSGLATRQWVCSGCGVEHHRDVNAARNILLTGLALQAKENEREKSALSQSSRKVEVVAQVSNKDGSPAPNVQPSGVGHDPLVVGIPFQVV